MSALIINANALNIPLADKSVQCVVTSPPYYGLRDYGTAKWEGGDPECDHLGKPMPTRSGFNERYFGRESSDDNKQDALREPMGKTCTKCGAVRIDQQIGLEQTPDEYVANLVAVFREVKRVLKDDGVLWLNVGDSYNGSAPNQSGQNGYNDGRENRDKRYSTGGIDGLKPKDLIGIPWMLAFALRADGWYLRQDIIWAKPNPMPESVKDRCTKSHEYIFLLSKSARYYYDNEAVKESSVRAGEYNNSKETHSEYAMHRVIKVAETRNKRDVWTVATKPYKGAHYATYPPDLITPCILAGAPETCCAKCGAPYERVVERDRKARNELPKDDPRYRPNTYHGSYENINGKGDAGYTFTQTLGFQPTCTCNAGTSSGIVFDPFVGSGTTVATAVKLGRRGVGLDLSMKYLRENARERIYQEEMQPVLCTREEVM